MLRQHPCTENDVESSPLLGVQAFLELLALLEQQEPQGRRAQEARAALEAL